MENISKLTPILYKKTETNFKHNGLGKLSKLLVYEIEEVLNGEFEAIFEYPTNGRLAKHIENEMFIKAKPNQKDDPHVFKIYDYELDTFNQTYLIYARSKNIEDLRNNVILNVNVNNLSPLQAYNLAKNNAVESVRTRFYSDITTKASVVWEHRNLMSIIAGEQGSMIQYWGGEIKHENDLISLYRRRGQDNVTTVRHNKNLDGLKATYSTKGLVTAIVPYYKNSDNESVYGQVVKSPYINNYSTIYYDLVEYSDDDLDLDREKEPEDGYSNSTILKALNSKASNWFDEHQGRDLIAINMEISLKDISQTKEYEKFKDFEQIEIGDTITVYSKKYRIHIVAKVHRVVYNGLTNKNEIVEVGTVRRTLYDDVLDSVDNELDIVNKELQEGIDHAMANANGKNTNYFGTADPNEVGLIGQEKDIYFRTNGQKKEMWIYKNNMWHLEISDMTGEEIKHELEKAEEKIKDARKNITNIATDLDEGTSFYKHSSNIGLASKNEDGTVNTIINLGEDGTAYVGGENVLLDANTTVAGDFKVTGDMLSKSATIENLKGQTMNFAEINTINFNAEDLVGSNAALVRASFNGISEHTQIEAGNINLIESSYWRRNVLTGTGMELFNGSGSYNKSGVIGYFKNNMESASYSEAIMNTGEGTKHSIGIGVNYTHDLALGRNPYSTTDRIFQPAMVIEGARNVTRLYTDLTDSGGVYGFKLFGGAVHGLYGISLQSRQESFSRLHLTESHTILSSARDIYFKTQKGADSFRADYQGINMMGNSIKNQSDIRLKDNVVDSELDALREIERLRFIEWDWKKDHPITKNMPRDRQFGIQVQYSPFLQTKDAHTHYLNVDILKQINLNSKGSQEMLGLVNKQAECIEKLTTRIEQLEGVIK